MWELQPLSTNRRTTKISQLLRENNLLTLSQIPYNFMKLFSLSYFLFLFSCGVFKARMYYVFTSKHPAFILQKTRNKGHQFLPHPIRAIFIDKATLIGAHLSLQ